MEFFREIEFDFQSRINLSIDDTKTVNPKLETTGIEGVAKFEGKLNSYPVTQTISKMRAPGAGVALIILGLGGFLVIIFLYGLSGLFSNLFYLFLTIGFIIMIVGGFYGFTSISNEYSGYIYLRIKGESYQGKALGTQGEKIAVLSRATIETDYIPSSFNVEFPQNLTGKLRGYKQALDALIESKLPNFELEKKEIPDTKS